MGQSCRMPSTPKTAHLIYALAPLPQLGYGTAHITASKNDESGASLVSHQMIDVLVGKAAHCHGDVNQSINNLCGLFTKPFDI